jgi:hypothetical protein
VAARSSWAMKKPSPILTSDSAPVSRRLKLALSGIALAAALTLAAAAQMFFSSFEHTVAVKGSDMDRDKPSVRSR